MKISCNQEKSKVNLNQNDGKKKMKKERNRSWTYHTICGTGVYWWYDYCGKQWDELCKIIGLYFLLGYFVQLLLNLIIDLTVVGTVLRAARCTQSF